MLGSSPGPLKIPVHDNQVSCPPAKCNRFQVIKGHGCAIAYWHVVQCAFPFLEVIIRGRPAQSEHCEEWFSNHQRRELHGLVLLSTQMCAHTCVSANEKIAQPFLGRLGSILRKRVNEIKPNLRVPPSRYVGKLVGSASGLREAPSTLYSAQHSIEITSVKTCCVAEGKEGVCFRLTAPTIISDTLVTGMLHPLLHQLGRPFTCSTHLTATI